MANSENPNAPSHRGLLALVIILGVLILLGVVGLIVAAVMRAGGNRTPANAAYAASLAAPGETVQSTQLDGNRVLVRLSGPKGEELVILDAGSGRVLGRIAISTQP